MRFYGFRLILIVTVMVIVLGLSVGAFATEWVRVEGPSVLVRAEIKPYISITVNSPATFTDNIPVIEFDVDRGPGLYDALHPLTIQVNSNQAIEVRMIAEELIMKGNTDLKIPPERLSFRMVDPTITSIARAEEEFQSFRSGESKKVFESTGPIANTITEYDFRLEVVPEDRAGTYEGEIFIEVFYQS